MIETLLTLPKQDRFRNAVDWAVFSVGALSLTIAIGATVAGSFGGAPAIAAQETAPVVAEVLPG